ncbi:MAG TPA: isoleucine--tRNA ligase [Candidatus Nanoarchaeia archaeon]|nr:isoleucine--tRNA ligase [Candidatus Nanoarchaeia archaeon]
MSAESENKIADYWEKNKIFEKSVEQRPKTKQYIFYDGPPFATGLPHYGHILGLTSKDLFCRYWTMKGHRVERKWGWDCHGLPIENIAEKELGLKDKKDIERIGVAKFNEFCRSKVLHFASEWKKTVRRMGKWIEFDNSYKTMDNSYMESVWHIFKKLHENGHVYEGKRVLLYCPHCSTPLSNAEIAMDNSYRDVTEKTATAKFKLTKHKDTFMLAWTTTPWTLIGNVALMINSDLTYVKIKMGSANYILAKDRLETVKQPHTVVEEFKGKKLLGETYEPLYPLKTEQRAYYVIDGKENVTATEGTGVVHTAPAYGELDYELGQANRLPLIQHINSEGKLVLGPPEWHGTFFKKLDKFVLEDLEKRNLLLAAENNTHSYPFCYRCDTPLFYNAVDSWFIDIQQIKPKLLERNEDINWYPTHLKEGRFKNVMETAPDWNISRNRFWATSMPVWKCSTCNAMKIIGSVKELQDNAVEKVPDNVDLHKHVVDQIHLKCSCEGTMKRIPEVFDCWLESGAMPYAAVHYPFENKKEFEKTFPADFISEYISQVRTWFYYMHVLGVLLFDKAPFKNVVVTGTILAEDGSKMSKSKKNYPDPNLIFDKYGADSLRFYLMNTLLMRAQDLNFNEQILNETHKKVTTLLSNVKQFYSLFAERNTVLDDDNSTHVLDKWMVSKTHQLIKEVTCAFDDYDTARACSELSAFVSDLSTWYVRRSRDRFKSSDEQEKKEAVRTLAFVLHTLAKLMAPITPFMAEEIQLLLREANPKIAESIHLELWPTHRENKIIAELMSNMELARKIVSLVLEKREAAKMPIRQSLSQLTILGVKLDQELLDVIKDEVNVKTVKLAPGKELELTLDTTLTPELIQEGIARELIRKINDYRKELKLTIKESVTLFVHSDDKKILESVKKHQDEIKTAVGAKQLTLAPEKQAKEIKLQDAACTISVIKA